MPNVGEILEIRKITDKHGNPMAFITVEFKDYTDSLTVFHSIYDEIKDQLKVGFVSGFAKKENGDRVLSHLFDMNAVEDWIIDIPDEKIDEFLSFYPSIKGSPNIVSGEFAVASIEMTVEMVEFIEANFGIRHIMHRRCHY
jgi:DNA polymerase III alpha subunit